MFEAVGFPPNYPWRIFRLCTLNGTGSEGMKQVEGSANGINWIPFAIKATELEAREAAVSCSLKTKHTYVRIIEVKK